MERQIKFRAKHIKNGAWLYGDLLQSNEGSVYIGVHGQYIDDGYHFNDMYDETCYVDEDTIGQFTGLLDKNGKEIYEGDILGVPGKDIFCRVVEYCCDGFYLVDNCQDRKFGDLLHREISLDGNYSGMAKVLRYNGYDYCVIGNIHDNPELISDKQ